MRHGVRIALTGGGVRLAALVLAAAIMMVPETADAREASWENGVGRRVVQKYNNYPVRLDGNPVPGTGDRFLIYRLGRVEEGRLWLEAEEEGIRGWAPVGQVIPVEHAMAYFTDRIHARPNDEFLYLMRMGLSLDQHKYTHAATDCAEILRVRIARCIVIIGARIATMSREARLGAPVSAAVPAGVPIKSGAREPPWRYRFGQQVVSKCRDFKLLNGQDFPARDRVITSHFVMEVKGNSLQIETSNGPVWVAADQVVLIDMAARFFSEAIRANPRDPFNYFMRAKVLLNESSEPDKALTDLNEAVRLDPKYASAYHLRAEVWSARRHWDKAIANYSEAIRLDPKDADSYLSRSEMWAARKDFDKALNDVNEAIRLDPEDDGGFVLRGNILVVTKEYDRAIANYKEAIRLDRRHHHNPAGRVASEGGNPMTDLATWVVKLLTRHEPEPAPGPADDDLERALGHGRELAWAYVARGMDRSNREGFDQAIADLNEAIRIDPRFAAAYSCRGIAWRGKREYEKALADLDRALRIDPQNGLAYWGRSMVRFDQKAYDQAMADCNEVIRLDPKKARGYVGRSVIWSGQKAYDKAIADLNEAIRIEPRKASAYVCRGQVRIEQKAYDKALADFDEAIRIDSKNDGAYCWRGEVWSKKREYDKALVEYDRAMRIDPRSQGVHAGRAWIWATAVDAKYRDGRKAVAAATKACELTGWKNAHALDTIAAASAQAGDFEAAVKWETKAIEFQTDQEEKTDYASRLALYREKKPNRDAKP